MYNHQLWYQNNNKLQNPAGFVYPHKENEKGTTYKRIEPGQAAYKRLRYTPIALRLGGGDIRSKNSTAGNLEINLCYTCYKDHKMHALLEQVVEERKAELNFV